MSEHKEPIPSMIYNAAVGGHVTNSQQIIDENENKEQSQINAEVKKSLGTGGSVDERIAEEGAKHYLKEETYNKSELNNMITTPNQKYVSFIATNETTDVTDLLPNTGAADTIYRVGNWNGTQYTDSVFSEYTWNGSTYIKLSTKSQIGEVYDISANHANTKYADLASALGTNGDNIPPTLRSGGMSIKFVQSYDNKYVQYRLMSDTFNTILANWQGVDDEPTAGSDNLVKSRGVSKCLTKEVQITDVARTLSNAKLVLTSNVFESSDSTDVVFFNVGVNKEFKVSGICSTNTVLCGLVNNVAPFVEPWSIVQSGTGQYEIYGKTTPNEPFVGLTVDKNSTYSCYRLEDVIQTVEQEIDDIQDDISEINKNINYLYTNGIFKEEEILITERIFDNYILIANATNFIKTSSGNKVICFNVGTNKKFRVTGSCNTNGTRCAIVNNVLPIITDPWTAIDSGVGAYDITGETTAEEGIVCISIDDNTEYHCYEIKTLRDKLDNIENEIEQLDAKTIVNVYTSDTEQQICDKMIYAFEKGNCDVIWQNGVYTFSDVYNYMLNTLGWTWTMELPIGNGCRYYFNNSTLISNQPSGTYNESRNILGCKAGSTNKMNFELYDAVLINNGGTYCVHDECARGTSPYIHKYKNIRMEYNMGAATENLSKCIGGGCGINGEIVIEDCIFINNNTSLSEDVSYHGLINIETPIKMNFFVSNSWFNHSFGVRSSLKETDDIVVKYSNCSQGSNDIVDIIYCTLYKFNIETRS